MSRHPRQPAGGGRVCMLVHHYFPRDPRVRREALALARAGLEVTVLALRRPGEPARETWQGISVVRLPVQRHRGSPLPVYLAEYLAFSAAASATVLWLAARRPFDVAHVHTPPDFLLGAAWPLRLQGTRLILDNHDPTPELYQSRFRGAGGPAIRRIIETVERRSCRACDRVVTATEAFRQCLTERGVPAERIRVVHNSPDPEVFDRRRVQPLPREAREFRIVHHGTLMHRYGEDVLLDAFRLLQERVPSARLHVYGEGDLLPRLRRMAAVEPLRGRVFLHGEVSQEEIAAALAAADVAVVPNRAGGIMDLAFPTKLLEAMQMGVPVVASATRLVAETFPNCVALVPPGDVAALAHTLYELALRPDARRRLSAEGYREVQRFSWEMERDKLLGLYRELGCRIP